MTNSMCTPQRFFKKRKHEINAFLFSPNQNEGKLKGGGGGGGRGGGGGGKIGKRGGGGGARSEGLDTSTYGFTAENSIQSFGIRITIQPHSHLAQD